MLIMLMMVLGIDAGPTASQLERAAADAYKEKLVFTLNSGQDKRGRWVLFGTVKNTGKRTVVALTVRGAALDKTGAVVFKESARVVEVESFATPTEPLRPGMTTNFVIDMNDAPATWDKTKATIEVRVLELAP